MAKTAGDLAVMKKGVAVIAGVRTSNVTRDAQPIDISDRDSNRFPEMLAGKGSSSSLAMSLDGLEEDGVLEGLAFDPDADMLLTDMSLVLPNGYIIAGNFWLSNYQQGHPYKDATTFTAQLASSGAWTFTAPV